MSKRIIRLTLLMPALTLLLTSGIVLAAIMSSNNSTLSQAALDGSGGSMSSDNYSVNFTVGQTVIGSASSDNYKMGLGFWSGVDSGDNIYLPIVIKGSQ